MLIWILAILLFVIVGALGYLQGAIRLIVSLIGLVVAAALAIPLGPTIRPLIGMMGVEHPVWLAVVPPLVVFLLLFLVGTGLSFLVHHKVAQFYKFRSDEVEYLRWERLNQRLGACLGVFMGTVWLVLIGAVIYFTGYLAVQVTTDSTESTLLKTVANARRDLRGTGLERLVARFDPMPQRYYTASDTIGLIYQNPILFSRLANYPPFLLMGDRPEIQDVANDPEFSGMLMNKADFMAILNHPYTLSLLQNEEIVGHVSSQDLADLQQYLRTGESPKFAEEPILGRWKLDLYGSLRHERKRMPNMSASQMRRLRKGLLEMGDNITFIATPDHQAELRIRIGQEAEPEETNSQAADPGYIDPATRYGSRYGTAPAVPQQPQPRQQAASAPETPFPKMDMTARGTWEYVNGKYILNLNAEQAGQPMGMQVQIVEGQLTIPTPAFSLVFSRVE